ncbi:hypothetical protein H5410_030198 [Solanum commersonii]|uniref:Uncharacterized protein n=1 Tax=Solanum commersonii TaxID=4109 RepID=A0A9J5YHY7_SOLCO|nr:hypothetical protein H5410_030198 [Solanum commersonii]
MIQDYLEEVRKNLLQTITQIDKSNTSMRSETGVDTARESQQAKIDQDANHYQVTRCGRFPAASESHG